MASETGQCIVRRLGRDDGDELPLVRDVEGVDPEDLGGAGDLGPDGEGRLVKPDGETGRPRRARSSPSQGLPALDRASSEARALGSPVP